MQRPDEEVLVFLTDSDKVALMRWIDALRTGLKQEEVSMLSWLLMRTMFSHRVSQWICMDDIVHGCASVSGEGWFPPSGFDADEAFGILAVLEGEELIYREGGRDGYESLALNIELIASMAGLDVSNEDEYPVGGG